MVPGTIYTTNLGMESNMVKGTLPQNIFILKSGHIGHINSLNIGCLNKFFKIFWQKLQDELFFWP